LGKRQHDARRLSVGSIQTRPYLQRETGNSNGVEKNEVKDIAKGIRKKGRSQNQKDRKIDGPTLIETKRPAEYRRKTNVVPNAKERGVG